MKPRIRLGILTPSSNTALEPLTQSITASLPNVSVHFSRFLVTKISLDPAALAQFQLPHILSAARLLADAKVNIIGWSGTSAGWLGFHEDKDLCRAITEATGIPATTSVLALNKALTHFGVRELGLVTPYLDDVQDRIIANYAAIGVDASREQHLRITENTAIADVGEDVLDRMVGEVAGEGVRVVTTFCTNLVAAQRVAWWEERFGILVFDTVATVIWDMLRHEDVDMRPITGWGRLFQEERLDGSVSD